jgi:hypothetical protein
MKKHSRWLKWQRGQALMEYWPVIPAALMVMLMGSTLATFIGDSILKTVDYLHPTGGLECDDGLPDATDGPTVAEHTDGDCTYTVELVGKSYNQDADETTVQYRVTSDCDPSISHWTLGIPPGLADNTLAVSEAYEWVNPDPTTGAVGIKFDEGYEGGSGGDDADDPDDGPPGGGPPGQSSAPNLDGWMLVSTHQEDTADSRTVLLTLGGHYDWDMATVTVKAGTQTVHMGTIVAPMTLTDIDEDCEM